jgi:putative membrane protein
VTEPDYRFTLANERTYLAWVRTSLGFGAAAVALHKFGTTDLAERVLAWVLALTALTMAVFARFRWSATDRAIRRGDPLPLGRLPALTALLVAGAAAITIWVLL